MGIKAPFEKKTLFFSQLKSHLTAHIVACEPIRSLSGEFSLRACAAFHIKKKKKAQRDTI